ncbi:MAG: hypothetical protein Q7J78_07535, partial [Clostridiales bacterium]|nr:hypothetical protein [Clostridiales bacterium]
LMRIISGSDYKLEDELGVVKAMISRMGEDGMVYNLPYREDTPWRYKENTGCRGTEARMDEEVSSITVNAMLSIALMQRYQRDNDPYMLEVAGKLINALVNIAIYKDDYAYYPATFGQRFEFSYYSKTGWPDTKEAEHELASAEGAVTCYISMIIRALSRYYSITKDNKVLDLAGRLTKYILKPQFWLGNIERWSSEGSGFNDVWTGHGGAQRKPAALYKAHTAGVAYTLEGLIDYALVAQDDYVKDFVRQGYEFMRNLGLAKIGMWGENIAHGYAAGIAIKLSDAGAGDYWEDVDQYIRNCMVEDQLNDVGILKEFCRERNVPAEISEFITERMVGGLVHNGNLDRNGTLDPTSNMAEITCPYQEPFYYVWEGITRYKDGMAQINLLLNRVSSWLDLESHLPYEGKVVIRNKTARHIAVRIPKWVDKSMINSLINGKKTVFYTVGNYIQFLDVNNEDVINIEFPMKESVESCVLIGMGADAKQWYKRQEEFPQYTMRFKGNTCVEVNIVNKEKFPADHPNFGARGTIRYPIYQREHMLKNKAPVKKVTRFVSKNLAEW